MKNIVSMIVVASAASMAAAAGSTFATATGNNGGGVVSGGLAGAQFQAPILFQALNQQINSTTAGPSVLSYTVPGLTGGSTYTARTSRPTPATPTFDTRLRVRDSANTVLGNNDDGGAGSTSPYSGVAGTIPGDGILSFDVAYWQNSAYSPTYTNAAAGASGLFDLTVTGPATRTVDAVSMQWWRFENLAAATPFTAAVIASSTVNYDTYFKVYDSAGNLIGFKDDGGTAPNGFWSTLTAADNVAVPADGIVYLGVTHFNANAAMTPAAANNVDWAGPSGSFDIQVTPAPGALALLGLGGLVAGRRRRA